MGFMDELRKLTQPYEDEDDFYEGSDTTEAPAPSEAQLEFENTFAGRETPEPAEEEDEDISEERSLPDKSPHSVSVL